MLRPKIGMTIAMIALLSASGSFGYSQSSAASMFPAKLKIQEIRKNSNGSREVVVNLEAEDGVNIYANPVGSEEYSHVALQLRIVDSDGKLIPSTTIFPKANRTQVDWMGGTINIFNKKIPLIIRYDSPSDSRQLTLQCRVAGNRNEEACLGMARLTIQLVDEKKTDKTRTCIGNADGGFFEIKSSAAAR